MAAGRDRAEQLSPEQMVARLAPSIERAAAERSAARDQRRADFPLMAEMTDLFREAGMDPRPVYARNEQGKEWGTNPDGPLRPVDNRPHTTPGYELRVVEMAQKWPNKLTDYRARMQRAIKPNAWRAD